MTLSLSKDGTKKKHDVMRMYAEELKKKNLTKEKQGTKSYLKNGFVVVERVLAFRGKKKTLPVRVLRCTAARAT